ncbi:SusC/RagA family TonB-linked outer membrane protein [Flavobacterium rhamnosiphilum]|uniref:SusC/RagA family TonB-linked outer membrane protein n=1 Tax=Flavobacterium rhamnosiphilum TaxID=2541724 RepID=A0A4R5F4R8_9FLAO|nr:SusC/RagA family TonB-linked outer membrane protein [Flavobacterium rhamnosiphilum]TDE42495.1 SusC/RagA family TonB-linked outer membrane protein [Flavobacterium rhamnosiphilum]
MKLKFNGILVLLVVLMAQLTFAQERAVSGVVSDNAGLPLPGVSVLVKGTRSGTQTDFDGKYSIKATSSQVLIFSYIGMKTQEMAATSTNLNVKLKDDSVELEGVVVTALGIKKRQDEITASNQVVKAKELTQAASPNIVQSLTGKVSGLQINTTSNGANPTTRIVLRGNRSITGNNQALVVIDNVVSSATILQQLPPEIIETVNIVKGMQGGALYGEQGVNGVIIVTTKKGSKNEKLAVSVNSAVDFESVSFLPKRQMKYGQGWAYDPTFDDLKGHTPWENGAWGPAFSDPAYAGTLRATGLPQADGEFLMLPWAPVKDNIKDFFKTGTVYQNGITMTSGGEDSYALLSINRQHTDFVVEGDQLKRNSFIFKGGKKIGKFSLDGNVNYISQSTSQTSPELYYDLLQTAPNIPISLFNNEAIEHSWSVYVDNPSWVIKNNRQDNRSDFFNGIATLNYEINKNINVNYVGNIQVRGTEAQSHINEFSDFDYPVIDDSYLGLGGSSIGSEYYANQTKSRNFYGDLMINFDYMLSDDVSFKLNVGNNIQDNAFRITSQGGKNLDIPGWYHINNVLNPDPAYKLDNRYVGSRKIAGFANVDFGYKNYLFLNATARIEKSSVVKNSYFYPSVGVSFIPTKAFEGIKGDVLSYAKVSANITQVASTSAVAAYATDDIGVFPIGYPFGSLSSYITNTRPTDQNIRPEFVTTAEASINLAFFNDRITLDASAYQSKTKDLITFATTSSTSGLAAFQYNAGDMKTTGFEIDLGFTPIKTKDFTWTGRASYTTNKSVIESLSAGATQVNLQQTASIGIFAEVGEEFPLIKGTSYVRDTEGHVIVDATTGNPIRDTNFKKLGKSTPDYILGFSNSFEYKGLKLTAVIDYRTGHQVYAESIRALAFAGHLEESGDIDREVGYVYPNSVVESAPGSGVYVPNTNVVGYNNANNGSPNVEGMMIGNYPGLIDFYGGNYVTTGENLVIDASAFKVRELALSYSLPVKFIEKAGLTSLRFGINARNPFVVLAKENKGYTDPEASNTSGNGTGIANVGQYPTTRTVGCSLNLSF